MSKGDAAGIILLSPEKEIEARMQIDKSGLYPGAHHPMELINQALESGQTIILSGTKHSSRVCLPLQTPRRQYGALWVEIQEDYWDNARFTDNLHTLANQAAIALERGILLVETRQQAEEIEAAYRELEITYDQTLGALSSALDARDRETEGHSLRVARIACQLGLQIGLTIEQAKTLERGAILHDIGKIGISDTILLKPGPLTPPEWEMMRLHPDIGARIIEGIPFLKDALPVIRYHQERWDGSGYPIGLKGNDIPLMARIFAIVDAFDALTTERPYRKPIPVLEAVGYLREQAGILFDPALVDKFEQMIKDGILESLI
jgi:response regulator RpfG family c-di-GMP phosphodiesterase